MNRTPQAVIIEDGNLMMQSLGGDDIRTHYGIDTPKLLQSCLVDSPGLTKF